ncbi:MAG: esterase/lipase family protein, partial [Candidatus Binatia bacterium]
MKNHKVRFFFNLAAILFFLIISPSLHAANLKIKSVALPGDPAPEGGTFTQIQDFSMNNLGRIVFSSNTSTNTDGIYLAADGTITRIFKPGDTVIIPEQILSGILVKKEFIPSSNVTNYQFSDGHRFSCPPSTKLQGLGSPRLNDAGDIVLSAPQGLGPPVLFSRGTLTSLSACSGVAHLIMDLSGDNFARIDQFFAPAISNTGTIVLRLFTTEGRVFTQRHFVVVGGTPTLFPLVGTAAPGGGTILDAPILDINDSGEMLVHFSTGLSFPRPGGLFVAFGGSRIPIAVTGQPAIEGKTFREIRLSAAMNNARETVFIAQLSDSRRAIFHMAPDGALTPLVRELDPIPGGGSFSEFHEVAINDNGDVVFNSSAIGGSGGIFSLSARGGLSKVVRAGEAAPVGENFTSFSRPHLTNQGRIAFRGFLSNGKSAIFLASVGLETEFVDPVPDLLAGSTVTPDEKELARHGTLVTGIAADGAARVVVRVKTGQPGTVEFSMSDREGESPVFLPADSFNGSLSRVGQSAGSGTVSVSTENVDGVGPMAFAAYHAPNDYARNPTSSEAGERERKAFIRIRLMTSTGETIETTEPLRIVRPPIVLVHGIWSAAAEWKNFRPLINDPKLFIRRVDYKETNAAHFADNAPIVGDQIKPFIDEYKVAERVAAVRADIVTHSMG